MGKSQCGSSSDDDAEAACDDDASPPPLHLLWAATEIAGPSGDNPTGDYLTVHSDETPASQELQRRMAIVLHLGTDGWSPECGGAFVWCNPGYLVEHGFNLFPRAVI